jgi:polar amino acid transport system substrate-binding protein
MQRRVVLGGFAGLVPLLRSAGVAAQTVSPALKAAFAPAGSLRVSINYGNAALAKRDPATGKLSGVSVDIAKELGRRLDLPLTLVPFDAAGKVTAAAAANLWDIAFLARDPLRAQGITFTAAYVVIDGNYVVRADSPITSMDQVDRDGIRICVSSGSAYDLFLKRTLKHATLIHAGSTPETVALFRSGHFDVVAGVKQGLQQAVASDPGLRMLPQAFMEIDQAMGTPAGRPLAAAYLHDFVETMKSSGEIAKILDRNGQADATVAPPG